MRAVLDLLVLLVQMFSVAALHEKFCMQTTEGSHTHTRLTAVWSSCKRHAKGANAREACGIKCSPHSARRWNHSKSTTFAMPMVPPHNGGLHVKSGGALNATPCHALARWRRVAAAGRDVIDRVQRAQHHARAQAELAEDVVAACALDQRSSGRSPSLPPHSSSSRAAVSRSSRAASKAFST